MNRIEVNVTTGERKVIELTPEEEADALARTAVETAARNTPEALRVVADETERATAKIDGPVLAFINQTRAECVAAAQANFPSLTVAERTRIGLRDWLLAVAIRKLMR